METREISKIGVTFSEYSSDDYDGFVNCIDGFYHGGYPYKQYLDKEYLDKKTKDGSMIVTIAKNASGKIVGTSAAQKLDGVFSGSVLLLLRCVDKSCRGIGIGSRQELYLFELISKKFGDALSLYADVMTHDAISQGTLCRRGFSLCGIRMMLYKNEIMVPALRFPENTKMSQAIYCKAVGKKDIKINVPDELECFIKSIYDDLRVNADFAKKLGKTAEKGVYDWSDKPTHSSAEFYIVVSGKDFEKEFLPLIESKISEGYTAVAYINAEKSGAVDVYEKLKENGFYFSGIKPLSENGEYIVMSHSKACKNVFENIILPAEKEYFLEKIIGGMNYES